jgi:lambda repressor-like predicted transcriptional regulator
MRERLYTLSAVQRDRLIVELRAKGATLREIGRRVGMDHSGVRRTLERIERGGRGRDRKAT